MTGISRHLLRGCACCDAGSSLSRRSFIAQAVAAGTAMALTPAQADEKLTKIDVHHHFAPDFHRDAVSARRGGLRWPKWSPQMSLDDMDKNGIATAMLSVVQPGTWFGDVGESRKLTRQLNDYAARLSRDHPGRFGLFACIAPPDTEGSLKEIDYVFDTLHADGIGLLTSYGTLYLGDPSFAPIYAELNRRKAIVYVHPVSPNCCKSLVPGIPVGSIEYATDTTRTIAHLVFSGTTTKFPDIRWIFSHSGGTLPFLTGRFTRLAGERKPAFLPNGPLPEFRRFHYELAQGNTPGQIAALLKMVALEQVLYGTDYPFRPGAEVTDGIAAYGFSAVERQSIERDAALKLLPRLKA
ncbi:MAG TPA: amidohydrolase family protein [Pseudolabrys sp.]|nr:amidohydrolase family protein [Pseudolabrys sp.]